jgi:hypothetical protein
MDYPTFKAVVAGFMQRDASAFVVGDVDLLDRAINQAKSWAQRKQNFELSRAMITVPDVDYQNGASLDDAVLYGSDDSVKVKTLIKAFLPGANSVKLPVDIITRDLHVKRLQRSYDGWNTGDLQKTTQPTPVSYWAIVRAANQVYVTPADQTALGGTTVDVHFDAYLWLPDYSEEVDTDFLLEFCEDFMLFRSVYQLNLALKEDMRIPVSKEALADSWRSVVEWNSELTFNSAEDASLD